MIRFTYANETDIPAALKEHYSQNAAGAWVLLVEGAVDKARLDEMRTNNVALQKTVSDITGALSITATEAPAILTEIQRISTDYTTLAGRRKELEDGKLVKAEGVDALVEKRTGEMKADFDKREAAAAAEKQALTAKLSKLVISDALVAAGISAGMREAARDDLLARGSSVFQLQGDKPVAIGADGQPVYGPTGDPLSMKEWVAKLSKDAPHLFEPSKGGGSNPGTRSGPSSGKNPFAKETFNLTEQTQLFMKDRAEHDRLKAAAGA